MEVMPYSEDVLELKGLIKRYLSGTKFISSKDDLKSVLKKVDELVEASEKHGRELEREHLKCGPCLCCNPEACGDCPVCPSCERVQIANTKDIYFFPDPPPRDPDVPVWPPPAPVVEHQCEATTIDRAGPCETRCYKEKGHEGRHSDGCLEWGECENPLCDCHPYTSTTS
jgi:hypothetical protein